jgi:ribosomal protein S4
VRHAARKLHRTGVDPTQKKQLDKLANLKDLIAKPGRLHRHAQARASRRSGIGLGQRLLGFCV